MSETHGYCRFVLHMARREAKDDGVAVPKSLTALRAGKRQFFVEAHGITGVYVNADCCAYEAKATYIHTLVEAKEVRS